MKILMVASEATPFAKTGGLADVLGALPAALAERGEQVAVVIPAYRENRYPHPTREAYRNLWIPLGPGYMVDIHARPPSAGVTYYFVALPGPVRPRRNLRLPGGDFPDNHLRFAVLSHGRPRRGAPSVLRPTFCTCTTGRLRSRPSIFANIFTAIRPSSV